MAIDKSTIARPYAKAAFQFAETQNALAHWSQSLTAAALITIDQQMASLLNNPLLRPEQLLDIYYSAAKNYFNEHDKNFLSLLAANKRLQVLPEIAIIFNKLRADKERTIDVDVLSIAPLSAEQQQRLTAALKKRLQREVALHCHIDENLIGGAVIRAGDFVIDGSVRGKLNRLSSELMV